LDGTSLKIKEKKRKNTLVQRLCEERSKQAYFYQVVLTRWGPILKADEQMLVESQYNKNNCLKLDMT